MKISGEIFLFTKTPKVQDENTSKLSGKRTEIGQCSGKIYISPKEKFPYPY